jgi:hypothetical protein
VCRDALKLDRSGVTHQMGADTPPRFVAVRSLPAWSDALPCRVDIMTLPR